MRTRSTLAVAALLLATACTTEDPTVATPPAEGTPTATAEPEPAGEDVTLTLLTHDSFNVSEDVLAAFTDASGVAVEPVAAGDAGTVVNQAILTRDSPQGDVLFGVDSTFLSRALDEDLFVAYESPQLAHVDDRFVLDDQHRVTPVDYGDVCLNHDRAAFGDGGPPVPEDLADLTDPAYEGMLVVQNPATSSPGLAFLLATIERFGEDGYLDFWADLVANDVLVTDGWSEAYYDEFSATGDGDRPLVVSYASSPPAEVFFADPPPEEAPTGVITGSCYRQVEFVGILQGTPHEAEAQALVDFMLSEEFQADVPLTMFVFPVRQGVELPEVYAEHAVVPEDPFELDPAAIGEGRDQWIQDWTATVLR